MMNYPISTSRTDKLINIADMTDTEKSIKEVRHSPRSIPLKGVIVGPTTINLMRFSRRVHLITNKKHHQASTSPR